MDITTILICIIASLGFIIGKIIGSLAKEEIKPGKKILKLAQDVVFGAVLVFLFITFNFGWVLSIILAAAHAAYSYLKNKKHKTLSLILTAAAIASTFNTKFFLYAASTAALYTLITGIRTKKWKSIIIKTTIVLALSLILIFLRII